MDSIRYLPDAEVDEKLDRTLRTLLTVCFGKIFRDKRFCFEMPPHRWLAWEQGEVVAHLAVHEKTFQQEGHTVPFIGVAEVCVAPPYRGRGLVKAMLKEAEAHLADHSFAVLLGDPQVYGSSGYQPVVNVYFPAKDGERPNPDALVKALGRNPWPEGRVVIAGSPF